MENLIYINKVWKKVKGIPFYLFLLVFPLLTACSEHNTTVEEYVNWMPTNSAYFSNLYTEAQEHISAGDNSWRILKSWTLEESMATLPENHIVAQIVDEGTGTPSYHTTDSVVVHYAGKLLPSTSFPEGYIFDKSYFGDFNPAVAVPVTFAINSVIDGFATALLEMKPGAHWIIYIPSALGYGAASQTNSATGTVTIPAYSTLIFDIRLISHHPAN